MKKSLTAIILAAVTAVNIFAFTACNNDKGNDKGGGGEVPKTIGYEDIYKHTPSKSETVTGSDVYKASYGYVDNSLQGYNAFYYRYREDGTLKDMSYSGGSWTGGGASMSDGRMSSASGVNAVRVFRAPVSGRAHIYGNPYLCDGENAVVKISVDGREVWSGSVYDSTGVYHSRTLELGEGQEVCFEISGNSTVYWNPTVDFTLQDEKSLHHTVDGYYGDVHPYYDERTGKLYMFYLSTGRQSGEVKEQFSSLLTTSSDFIRYEDTKIQPDSSNPPEQELYYALGVYKDKDGNYRSSYGYGNYAGASKSTDLINWQTGSDVYIDEADGLLKYTFRAYFDSDVVSGRDPDITYDPESGKYYCVVMNYYTQAVANGSKGLALYTAGEDGKYSTKAVKLLDCTGRGDPECPQLKKIGNRWYLFYSIYGTGSAGNVGNLSYRVGDENVSPDKVNWNAKEEFALDGGDLHAAQVCQVGDKWYMYGWLNYTPHANVWGGYLNMAREVYVKDDGTLAARCDSYLTDLLNMGRVATFEDANTTSGNLSYNDGTFTAAQGGRATLDGEYGRSLLFADVELPAGADRAGYELSAGGRNYFVGLQRANGKLYLSVYGNPEAMTDGCRIEIRDASQTSFRLKIVADGKFIEAFVNDEYALSAHTYLNGAYTLGISAYGTGASVGRAEVCKLADYNNIFD